MKTFSGKVVRYSLA